MPWRSARNAPKAETFEALQFGHGCDAVEMCQPLRKTTRHQDRFNSATAVMPWRSKCLGFGLNLQVGFNSATAVMPWRCVADENDKRDVPTLQFGHGCDAVEIPPVYNPPENSIPGFNSATAVMPWRCPSRSCPKWLDAALQFGHGCDAVEIWYITEPQLNVLQLQFGHGCDAVEIGRRRAGPVADQQCFNSATAVMPWRFEK